MFLAISSSSASDTLEPQSILERKYHLLSSTVVYSLQTCNILDRSINNMLNTFPKRKKRRQKKWKEKNRNKNKYQHLLWGLFPFFISSRIPKNSKLISEAYSEPSWTSKMDLFAKIVNGWTPLTIFAKRSILDVRLGSEYASDPHLPSFPDFFKISNLEIVSIRNTRIYQNSISVIIQISF